MATITGINLYVKLSTESEFVKHNTTALPLTDTAYDISDRISPGGTYRIRTTYVYDDGGESDFVESGDLTYSSDYIQQFQDVINLANANSITLPSTARRDELNQKITDLVNGGYWAQLDGLVLQDSSDVDSSFNRIDMKRLVLMTQTSLTDTSSGKTGNGGYLATGFNLSNDSMNMTDSAFSIAFKCYAASSATHAIFGGRAGSDGNQFTVFQNAGQWEYRLLQMAGEKRSADISGLNFINRQGTTVKHYVDGALVLNATSGGSGVLPDAELYFYAMNTAGEASLQTSSIGLEWMYWGADLEASRAAIETILG